MAVYSLFSFDRSWLLVRLMVYAATDVANPRLSADIRVYAVLRMKLTGGYILGPPSADSSPGQVQGLAVFELRKAAIVFSISMFPTTIPGSLYLAASLVGFATGTAISVLLLVFSARAAKLPGASAANILFVACCLIWNVSGLAHSAALACGEPERGRLALIALTFQYTAAAAWPCTVISLWRPLATSRSQKTAYQALWALSVITCTLIVTLFWHAVISGANSSLPFLKESTPFNGAILLMVGMAVLRKQLLARAIRLAFLAMLGGAFGAMTAVLILQVLPVTPSTEDLLRAFSEQITLLVVLGAFFLFARFRFSDLFIRHSLRAVLATFMAAAFTLSYDILSHLRFHGRFAYPGPARASLETLMAASMLVLFTFVDRHTAEFVNRWIYRASDYRALLRDLSDKLARLRSETEIANIVERAACHSLELRAAHLVTLENLSTITLPIADRPEPAWLKAINDGELIELDCEHLDYAGHTQDEVELLVPVRSEGRVIQMLAISPGPARRGLVTHEVNHLRDVAAQFGHRLDQLHREERLIVAQSREAVLQQQVTEAELRALRAQVNPHFLFNSLNSIANLVVTNPGQAETMTLRLARVFRHVLANSARPLIPLHEEIAFLKTYLQIEEARFGSRLQVKFNVDPAVAMEQIPSLMLQPLVENALKHGLGPKPGPGHLWITVEADGDQVRLRVEDDGIGPATDASTLSGSNGVGLENVAQRLNALYQDQGRLMFEARETGGTLVTILLPRESGAAA